MRHTYVKRNFQDSHDCFRYHIMKFHTFVCIHHCWCVFSSPHIFECRSMPSCWHGEARKKQGKLGSGFQIRLHTRRCWRFHFAPCWLLAPSVLSLFPPQNPGCLSGTNSTRAVSEEWIYTFINHIYIFSCWNNCGCETFEVNFMLVKLSNVNASE